MVHVALGELGVGHGGGDESEEELVDELEVRPGGLQGELLVVSSIERRCFEELALVVGSGREGSEEVGDGEFGDLLHRGVGELCGDGGDVVDEVEEGLSFDVFLSEVLGRVGEVEEDAGEGEFLDEESGFLGGGDVSEARERFVDSTIGSV